VTERSAATTESGDGGTGTSVIRERVEELAHSPVFVDSTGRRRTWVTWTLGLVAGACVGYLALLALSFVGGPITPKQLLPLPGVPNSHQRADVSNPDGGGTTASGTTGSGGTVGNVPPPLGGTGGPSASTPPTTARSTPTTARSTTPTPSSPATATSTTLPVPPLPTTIPTPPPPVPSNLPPPSSVLPPATAPVPVGG
jgi:hypothetical protein